MKAEQIITLIIEKHPEVSEEEVLQRLKKEKQKTGGLISDETLLRIIAGEFDVDVRNVDSEAPSLAITDLVPNLNDVTMIGRVMAVFQPRTFTGQREGKIASLLVADSKEILRVIIWDGNTTLIEEGKIKTGQTVKFSHCYTKEDRFGKIELHAGEKCEIEVDPSDAKHVEYASIEQFLKKINEVTESTNNMRVNTRGVIDAVFPSSEFLRKDGTSGKVMKFTLADETGVIPIVVWNEKVEELERNLERGSRLQIVNGKVRNGLNGKVEVQIDSESLIEVLPTDEFLEIVCLKEGATHVNVKGEIVGNPVVREVTTFRGERVELATFELKDETGSIQVSAWRRHARATGLLKAGDKVELKEMYVKKGFREALELVTRDESSLKVSS